MKLNKLQIAIDREIVKREGLYGFLKVSFPLICPGEEFVDGQHLKILCNYAEDILNGKITRSVVNIPPGHSKSIIFSVLLPVYAWIVNPSLKIINISYSPALAVRDAGKALQLLQDDWFVSRWGNIVPDKRAGKKEYKNAFGGWRLSTSIKGRLTGSHADLIIIDDCSKAQDGKTQFEEVLDWFKNTLPTRIKPNGGRCVLIQQRLSYMDASEYCIERGWDHLCLPARFEEKFANKYDFRKKDGELLYPGRFNDQKIKELEESLGSNGFAQLQQRPLSESESIFKKQYFKYYKELPEKFNRFVCSFDLSFKGNANSDYNCGILVGQSGPDYYVLKVIHEKLDFTDTIDRVIELKKYCENNFKRSPEIIIEDRANGPAVINSLKKKIPGIIAYNPGRNSKEERASSITYLFRAENVWFPDTWKDSYFEQELLQFPKSRNDDLVDALTQALIYFIENSFVFSGLSKKNFI